MNNKGFTLIEIIIVIVILGILATLAVPKIVGQMESSRAAEVMQMFGAFRRAATDCLSMSNGAAASCTTSTQLGVSVPTTGAAFTYTSAADSPNASQIQFKAVRPIGTPAVNNAICMVITQELDAVTSVPTGNIAKVAYGVYPANSPFAGIVNRANSNAGGTGVAAEGCANATALTAM